MIISNKIFLYLNADNISHVFCGKKYNPKSCIFSKKYVIIEISRRALLFFRKIRDLFEAIPKMGTYSRVNQMSVYVTYI